VSDYFAQEFDTADRVFRSLSISTPCTTHGINHATVFIGAVFLHIYERYGKASKKVAELGSGCGALSLFLARQFPYFKFSCYELQKELHDYAILNSQENNIQNVVFNNVDVSQLYRKDSENVTFNLQKGSFDIVLSNPPHYIRSMGVTSEMSDRRIARTFDSPQAMSAFFVSAYTLLRNKGTAIFVLHPNILIDVYEFSRKNGFEPFEQYNAYSSVGKDAQLSVVLFRKNGGKNFILRPPVFLRSSSQ